MSRTRRPDPLPFPAHLDSLPKSFIFGTATAAYQIEGAVAEGFRGPSIWDTFSHEPGRTHRGDNGDVACDHYRRWETDLDLMAALGYPGYRLSLSWARLQPTGRGSLNPAGIAFYRGLLSGCRVRGIRPFVTLYHWDLPQALQGEGGWESRDIAACFAEYARLTVEALGDLASDWITINEPWCVSFLSNELGVQAPGKFDTATAVRVAHHVMLGHGLALREIRRARPELKVGITNIITNLTPRSDSDADRLAVQRSDIHSNRMFLEPLYLGHYTDDVVAQFAHAGLHQGEIDGGLVQPGDLALISAPTDFVGINHYHDIIVGASESGEISTTFQSPIVTSFGWSNTPGALGAILRRIDRDYSKLPIYVTENGATFFDYVDTTGEVRDYERIDYVNGYVNAIGAACADGIDVQGYFCWSFMDNFEWAEGFDKRFGLVYVDFKTQERIPKASAYWYRDMIARFNELT